MRARRWEWAIPILVLLLFLFWNPVGFVGGGGDDDRYLSAAVCWLENGPCLPVNHWEGRWPVIAPLTLSISALGVNRLSIGLPALLASGLCLALLKWHGDRLFDRPVGLSTALIFGLLPVFSIQALSATVEPIELAFILSCFAALLTDRPLLAGLALALAFQTRETAIAGLLPAAFLLRHDRKALVRFGLAFLVPLAVEFVFFHFSTGDPLYRRTLSVEHTLIPSSELRRMDAGVPFLNASLMANWKYEPGLHIHWLIDGFANLLVNLKTGLLFVLAPLFYGIYRRRLTDRQRRIAGYLLASAFFYAAVLIYGLAIDPKPRMMYVPLAALSAILGLVAVRCWNPVIASTLVVMVPLAGITLASQPRHLHWQRLAEEIHAAYPGMIETPQAGYFTLSRELRALPSTGSGKPYLLIVKSKPCRIPSEQDPFDLGQLALISEQGSNRAAMALGYPWRLCLFRYPENFRAPAPPRLEDQRHTRVR